MNNVPLTKLELEEVSYLMYLPDAETDDIQQKITKNQQPYEYVMLRDIAAHLTDADVFVDIGANIGNHSIYLAAVTGCQVHAFEPNPHLAAALKQNVLANGLEHRIIIHNSVEVPLDGARNLSELEPSVFFEPLTENSDAGVASNDLETLNSLSGVTVLRVSTGNRAYEAVKTLISVIEKFQPSIYAHIKDFNDYNDIVALLGKRGYECANAFNECQVVSFLPRNSNALSSTLVSFLNDWIKSFFELKRQLLCCSEELKNLQKNYFFSKMELEKSTREYEQLRSSYATQTNELKKLEDKSKKVAELELELSKANEKYRNVCANIDLEKNKRLLLTEQLQEKHQLLTAANQKYKHANEQIAKLKQEIAQATANKNSNKQAVRSEEAELRLEHDVQRADAAEQQLVSLKAEHTQSQQLLAQMTQSCQEQAELLQQVRKQLESKETELNAAINSLGRAEGDLVSLTQKMGLTEQQLKESDSELRKLQQALATALQQQDDSHAEIEQLQQALAENRRFSERLTVQLEETKTELTQAIRLRVDAQQSAQNMHALMQQQNSELSQLQTLSADQSQQLNKLQQEFEFLTEKNQQQQALYEQQQQHLAALTVAEQAARQDLERHSAQAVIEINELKQKLSVLQELQEVRNRTVALNPHYQQLTEKLSVRHDEVVRLQQKLAGLQQQYDNNHAHLKNARRQLEQKQQLEKQNTDLEQQLAIQIKQKDSLQQQYIHDRSELDLLKALQKVSTIPATSQPPAELPMQLQPVFDRVWQQQQILAKIRVSKIACIMDEFTFGSYAPEANLLQLTPQYWQRELEGFQPDLLFIESAWRGKHEIWGNKVGHKAQELVAIVEWCNLRGIPTIFWNKEDPVHFETFISTAKLFDHVFTTDFDCIHRYKAALEHHNVYLLPFAAQPSVNNPIELYPRKDAFSFAGAYYVRYPDRTRDLDDFLQHLPQYKPVEIYDRNFGKDDPNYMFPESYQPFIVGNLPYDQIDKAYKGYRYAINLNSIKHSQTMFARRAYELLASNTLTVSNYSRGIELMFGELVLNSDSGQQIVERLNRIEQDNTFCRKFQLQALRKVMQNHTYQDRLGYVLQKAGLLEKSTLLPQMVIAAYASNQERAERILLCFNQQQYNHKQLLLVTADQVELGKMPGNVQLIAIDAIKNVKFSQLLPAGSWFGFMVADDYYGPNYLTDLALATRYSPAPAIGKIAHYRYVSADEIRLNNEKKAYRPGQKLEARSSIFRTELFSSQIMYQWLRKAYQMELELPQVLAIDPFNYCKAVPLEIDLKKIRLVTDDAEGIASGMPYAKLEQLAEQLPPQEASQLEVPAYNAQDLHRLFKANAAKSKVQLDFQPNYIDVMSELPDGKHEYLYADTPVSVKDLPGISNGQFDFFLEASTGMNLQLLLVFLDADKKKISHEIRYANKNHRVALPPACAFIQFALRFYASGACSIKRLVFGQLEQEPQQLLPQSDVMLLTNHYPSYQDLYRNGFVHTRVKAYREHGVSVDVFRLRKDEPVSWHEYQAVQVCTASQQALRKTLATGRYKHVLVHFLDAEMWEVLQDFVNDIRVTVWVHGSEVQPWWRREYNYNNEAELAPAKLESDKRIKFWREVLTVIPRNLRLVFVSDYFAREVMEDLAITFPDDSYEVIHNPIDTKLFSFEEKDERQRFKILSIRPYASRKYANDLSVNAVLELSKKDFFKEMVFHFIGDGKLFNEVLSPLREFENVIIEQKFIQQNEISALHKEYGVFLCPTRMDAQGVSKDEAMSSGLVPVTNAVTAIPEFVDDTCGILVPGEDAIAMARGIEKLVLQPELFKKMSAAAAERARKQVDSSKILALELRLFTET